MDKVIVKTDSLSRMLFNLVAGGYETIGVSLVDHAVKLEGMQDGNAATTLHVWSSEAEDVELNIGKGEELTTDEIRYIDQGKCPKCADHPQLYKGKKKGLARIVNCESSHQFWVPPLPFKPEYMAREVEAEPKVQEPIPPAPDEPTPKEQPPVVADEKVGEVGKMVERKILEGEET